MKNVNKRPAKATENKAVEMLRTANAKANNAKAKEEEVEKEVKAKVKKEVKILKYTCPHTNKVVTLNKTQSYIYGAILALEAKEEMTADEVARYMTLLDRFEDKGRNRVYAVTCERFKALTKKQKIAILGKTTMPTKKEFFDKLTEKYPDNVFFSKLQGNRLLKEFNENLKLKNKVDKQNKSTANK